MSETVSVRTRGRVSARAAGSENASVCIHRSGEESERKHGIYSCRSEGREMLVKFLKH